MITFGIANSSKYDVKSHLYIEKLIKSIEDENIPNVEIICCGDYKNPRFKCLEICEDNNPISKKLNTFINNANNEILVMLRDYMVLMPGWWKGFQKFGFDWDLSMCVVANTDLTRFRDWAVWLGNDLFPNESWTQHEWGTTIERTGKPYLPSYSYDNIKKMYISGGLFIGKTEFFRKHKFDDNINLGQAEDVKWYDGLRLHNFSYKMNRYSCIQLQKYKDRCLVLEHEYFGTWDYIKRDLM